MKVKLFTHTDLDGLGCAVVSHHMINAEIDVEFCDYNNIDDRVRDFTASMGFVDYDKVFITDISVSDEVANLIDYSITGKKEYLNKFQLLDHHGTALNLNRRSWANVITSTICGKTSGTSMLYDYLRYGEDTLHTRTKTEALSNFVEEVRRYDTWEWTTIYNDNEAKRLNDLLNLLGRERFLSRFYQNPGPSFDNLELTILELEEEKINSYVNKMSSKLIETNLDEYKVGVVFAELYSSILGNELAKQNPHLDFIVLIDMSRSVSFRGIHDNIDLGKVAEKFGGGGHPKAAGCPLDQESINSFIKGQLDSH